jgi:hypothetical protein
MTKSFPYLALDSAGRRTILCDHPVPMFGDNKKETQKMTLSADQLTRYVGMRIRNPAAADRYWARCMGQDAAMDDETVGRIKEFLSDKLSDEDHAKVCSMLSGDVDAQDTEPDDVELPKNAIGRAADAKADFLRRFPDAAKINIDSSGIQPSKRASSYSDAGAASFAAMFPDAMQIRLL